MAGATLDGIAAQVAAISLRMDEDRAARAAFADRVASLELVASAILQALRFEQMPALGTVIEKLEKLQEAASDRKAGGELAAAIRDFAGKMESVENTNMQLVHAVRELQQAVILASGGGIDLPNGGGAPEDGGG